MLGLNHLSSQPLRPITNRGNLAVIDRGNLASLDQDNSNGTQLPKHGNCQHDANVLGNCILGFNDRIDAAQAIQHVLSVLRIDTNSTRGSRVSTSFPLSINKDGVHEGADVVSVRKDVVEDLSREREVRY
jgi:hypothetical protein